MSMSGITETEIIKFDETVLLKIKPGSSTLPIDTSAEWTKGFQFLNQLLSELGGERFVDKVQDSEGKWHKWTRTNPMILPLMRERRLMVDQIFKISGAEAIQEIKKESAKSFAKMIFETNVDKKLKDKYRKEAFKFIEAEEYEEAETITD